jgi:predicted Zn-dependent protease
MIRTGTRRFPTAQRRRWTLLALAASIVLPLIAGCSVNPATGRQSFTGCLSESDERQIGAENHPQVLAEFGGEYDNPAVKTYVNDIGQRLARLSDRPNVNYTFTVLNTPDINAFAVPGGYIYVTRGLMALGQNEAELAGVISHEIGHIAAKHTNERYCRAMVAQLGVFGLGAATGSQAIAQAANTGAAIYLQGYSRDQEFEADLLGVRYLGRGSYDPNAMSTFLSSMLENSRLEATLAGSPNAADQFSIFQTHPRTADRVQRAIEQASGTQVAANPIVGRDVYLDHINNILYGDDPKEGLINGRRFSHPALRFEFTVPEGFRLYNSASAVVARGPNNGAPTCNATSANNGRSRSISPVSTRSGSTVSTVRSPRRASRPTMASAMRGWLPCAGIRVSSTASSSSHNPASSVRSGRPITTRSTASAV